MDKMHESEMRYFGHVKRKRTYASMKKCERSIVIGVRRCISRKKRGVIIKHDMSWKVESQELV